MKVVKGIARFCYDFVVGDDWKVAAAVVTGLAITGLLYVLSALSDGVVAVVGAALLVSLFTGAMYVDVRGSVARR